MNSLVIVVLDYLLQPSWSPYVAGAGIGIVVCLALSLSNRPLGCSSGYAKACGLITLAVRPGSVERSAFYRIIVPAADWQFMVIPGIMIGAFLGAVSSGTFHVFWVPPLFAATFGDSVVLRLAISVLGGFFLALGALWAGGCTSGHGISGTLQLSLSSMVAAACFFAGGVATAFLLFRVIGA